MNSGGTPWTDLDITVVEQRDPRLGRQKVHDERSRRFAASLTVDRSTWRTKMVRIVDPLPNPKQTVGNCTGCQKAMAFNAVGNRKAGTVHQMEFADKVYSWASANDPWQGAYPPDDTGSSGLAACKAAQTLGVGGEYRWLFGGADEVVQAIMAGETVGCGTWWYQGMFERSLLKSGRYAIEPTGTKVGGHQYTARGYDAKNDLVIIRCWWGTYRDVGIKRQHLNDLLMDGGDANVQVHA